MFTDNTNDAEESTGMGKDNGGQQYGYGTPDYGGQGYGGQNYGGQNYGNQGYGTPDYGGQSYGGQNYGGQNYGNQGYGTPDFGGQSYGGQNYGEQNYGNQGYGTPDLGGQNYGGQNYGNQGYGTPDFSGQSYGGQNYGGMGSGMNSQVPGKKNKKKIILISVGCIVAVALITVLLVLILGGGIGAKRKIKSEVNAYAENIEKLDVSELVNQTAPKKLIKQVIIDVGKSDANWDQEDIQDFEDEFDEAYDKAFEKADEYIKSANSIDLQLTLNDFKVNKVEKVSVEDIVQKFYDEVELAGTDNAEEALGYSVKEMTEIIEDKLADYNIDSGKIYMINTSCDVSLKCKYFDLDDIVDAAQSELGLNKFSVNDLFDHFYAYEYDGEYYILPGVDLAVAPAMVEYVHKYNRSSDVEAADEIRTAVQTCLSDPDAFDGFVESGNDGKYVLVTEDSIDSIPYFGEELTSILGDIEEYKPQYRSSGYEDYDKFAFRVDLNEAEVIVYVTDGEDYVELSPDSDGAYR